MRAGSTGASLRPILVSTPAKQVRPWPTIATAKVVVESLPCRLSQLKANGPAGLPLPDIGSVEGIAVGRHIIDAQGGRDRSIAIHIEGSSFPNWNGADQKRAVAITGDRLTLTVRPPNGDIVDVVWKRAK